MTTPQQQFIADIYPSAKKVSEESGASLDLILAQTATETGWGQKVLPGTNNLFNIKADASWHGKTAQFNVPEYDQDGNKYMSKETFRVYDSYEDSFRDRQKFLAENPRYAKAGLFDEGTKGNMEKEANALQKAGYATDPHYAATMAKVAHGPTMRAGIALAGGKAPDAPVAGHTASHAGTMREGDRGDGVRSLQASLAGLGYTDQHGRPLKPDADFGPATEHALKAFQHDHGLREDGIAGKATLGALADAKAPQASAPASTMLDAKHPAHGMYQQAYQCVAKLDESHGRSPGPHSQMFAGSLTAAALQARLSRIDHVALSGDASRGYAIQGDVNSPFKQHAEVNVMQAVQTPLAQSSRDALAHIEQNQKQQMPAPQVAQEISQQQEAATGWSR